MADEIQPTRQYGRRAPLATPKTPWFMKTASAAPSPPQSPHSSSSSQEEVHEAASGPFSSAPAETATSSRRSSHVSVDTEEPNVTEISPTSTPRTRRRTLPPSATNSSTKSVVPTPKKAVRRLQSDPFAFEAEAAPSGPPPKRIRKAVAIPESLITLAPPTSLRRQQPATPTAPEASWDQDAPRAPSSESSRVPELVQQPPPLPASAVEKRDMPVSLQHEPITTTDSDAFGFDLPKSLPTHQSSSTTPASATIRPPVSQPATPRLVIPRSESQLLGNFFDSDEEDCETHPPSAPEPIVIVKPLKRKASMDTVSAPPSKKIASAGTSGFDSDPFADPFDSQGSSGTPVEIRTLHEMREAGENRRIAEEAEFLAQGLDSTQPLALRQYSALDLLRKLSKPAQRRKLASNNSLTLLLSALSNDSDPIIMLCFLLTVHAILSDPDIHHAAVESLALDKYLFQPHFVSALSSTAPPNLPTPTSKQTRGMLSDLNTLADSISVPADMLSERLLWVANVHKLAHLAPGIIAGVMDTTQVSALIQSTLALGLKVSQWSSGSYLEHSLGLLDQLSFMSTSVSGAFTHNPADILSLARFAVRAHGVLASKVTGDDDDQAWTSNEWAADEVDLTAAVLTTLRIVINVTHADPAVIDALVAAEGGEVVRELVAVGLSILTGPLSVDPVWLAVHRSLASGGAGGATGGTAGGAGAGGRYSQSSQSQPMAADMDAIASISDRSNPKLVAVGLLLNLAEGAPEVVGEALAGMPVESLVHVVESGSPEPESDDGSSASAQPMALGVISAFAAVVLATALLKMDATAREKVRTRFMCATWGGLRRGLERFIAYQQVGNEEVDAVAITNRELGNEGQTNGHWLLQQVNDWL